MAFTQLGLAAGGALLGGVLSAGAAKQQNKAIKRTAETNFKAVDQNIRQSRMAFFEETEAASKALRARLGAARAGLGFDGGQSATQYLAQQVVDAEMDQLIRRSNQQATEQALQSQKEAVAAQASQGMVDPTIAGIQGAMSGAQQGMALGSAIDGLQMASAQEGLLADQRALAQTEQQLFQTQIHGLNQRLQFEQQMLGFSRQQFGAAAEMRSALGHSPFTLFPTRGNPLLPGGGS